MNPPAPSLVVLLTRVQDILRTRGVTSHLVGGLLRDQRLGRTAVPLNVDLVVPRQAVALAQALAQELRGTCVPLDAVAGCARVIVESAGERIELDVSDYRAATLEDDLRRRDFTVNALAVSLADWLRLSAELEPLLDPCGGLEALQHRRLLACFPGTFEEDPLRILRAFRFAAQLEFTVDPSLAPLMTRAVPRIAQVSGERVRDELLAIFATDRAHPAIQALNALGVLDVLVPELIPGRGMEQGDFHHLDVLAHQVETVAQADRFLADFAEFSASLRAPMAAYCAQQPVEHRSRKALIKLSGLLHDVGKPARRTVEADGEIWFLGHDETGAELVAPITERLRLSNREAHLVCQMVRYHLRPGFLSREPVLTRRAVYRFFKDLGDDGPACLLTWWADRMATRGPRSRLDQLDQQRARLEELLNAYFFKAEEVVRPPRLVDGKRLMAHLGLPPGPVVGELLNAIEEAQAEGTIHSADEALALAQARLRQPPGAP